tara:strand:+ start:1458 stop:1592 length:135 start_codon:yes stop_codon:yes gene_type:complete
MVSFHKLYHGLFSTAMSQLLLRKVALAAVGDKDGSPKFSLKMET